LVPESSGIIAQTVCKWKDATEVVRLVAGVTASQALLDAAVARNADAILVHHGYFWKGEDGRVTGIRRQRLATLLAHDINLLAYHLPLDAHPELGNNAQLAQRLGWVPEGVRRAGHRLAGSLAAPADLDALAADVQRVLGRVPLVIGRAASRFVASAGVPAGRRVISSRPSRWGSMPICQAKYLSRPSIWQGKAASPTLPPGIMPPSVTVCRRWPNTLAGNWVSPASLSISTTRSD
jgi:hypothetical protein